MLAFLFNRDILLALESIQVHFFLMIGFCFLLLKAISHVHWSLPGGSELTRSYFPSISIFTGGDTQAHIGSGVGIFIIRQ